MLRITLDHIEQHAPAIQTFWFTASSIPRYNAGQFIELVLPDLSEEGRGNRRWFTLSSSPSEPLLAITTTFTSPHLSPYKQKLSRMKPGDIAFMSDPMGDFILPMQPTTPITFVASGIGATPMRSMVKWLHDMNQTRIIRMLYAANNPDTFLFDDIFTSYGLQPRYLLTKPSSNWEGKTGKVTAESILDHYTDNGLIYIAGPEQMTERLVHELREKGLSPLRLVTDYFPGYPE